MDRLIPEVQSKLDEWAKDNGFVVSGLVNTYIYEKIDYDRSDIFIRFSLNTQDPSIRCYFGPRENKDGGYDPNWVDRSVDVFECLTKDGLKRRTDLGEIYEPKMIEFLVKEAGQWIRNNLSLGQIPPTNDSP